jgi:hydrogenase/urease accessory protein HupE
VRVPWRALAALLVLAVPQAARAHDFRFTDVRLTIGADGAFRADVSCDLDALALGVDASADSTAVAAEIAALPEVDREKLAQDLVALLQRRLRVRADGRALPLGVTLSERGRARPPGELPSAFGLVARLEGTLPADARTVTFFASRAFPPVRLTIRAEGSGVSREEVLGAGEESQPFDIAGAVSRASRLDVGWRFLRLGFGHILPLGLDHVAFVVALAVLSSRLAPLLAQVTAFTLAHTVTLALSTYGLVRLPSPVVEPLIALSIVYVAVENVVAPRLRPARVALVFGFGLLHGLGFAGALDELGWPEGRRLLALLAFNVGVELGQLAVIGLALGASAAWTRGGGQQETWTRAVSGAVALAGLYWLGTRLFGA